MNISSAVFQISAAALSGLPEATLPEIAFVGRSNVGKSSLLNSLVGKKGLAKTSATPGKTRLINYFLINERCYFVDLPGYGYAAVSHVEKEAWGELLSSYIAQRNSLVLTVMLMDSRHPAMANDKQMLDFLDFHHLPYGIVLTKYDKLSQKEKAQCRRTMESYTTKAKFIVNYSSFSALGKRELLDHIGHYLS